MTEEQLLDEIKHYVSDNSYNYAIMIDGEWGSGKTYFIKTTGTQTIKNYEVTRTSPKEVEYISLYGCKTVEDIQERLIVKVLARISKIEKYKKKLPPAVTTLLVSSKSLAKGSLSLLPDLVIPMLLPGNSESVKKVFNTIFSKGNTADAVSKYLSMKSYIFIFDDLERCECPMNEILGFINELVEHEGTKVIIIANEKEIIDDDYKTKREKVIGTTLEFTPDIINTIKELIENSDLESELKQLLFSKIDFFRMEMFGNDHINLRTFQFYISKLNRLYKEVKELNIDHAKEERVVSFVITDSFERAVDFKGNHDEERNLKTIYNSKIKSPAIKNYIEKGEFDKTQFKSDIDSYIEEEIDNRIDMYDPYSVLENNWYNMEQEAIEEKIKEVKKNIANDKYPSFAYARIIFRMISLRQIGFSEDYLNGIIDEIKKNIRLGKINKAISDDTFFIEDKILGEAYLKEVNLLNKMIEEKNGNTHKKVIVGILEENEWVDRLIEYARLNSQEKTCDNAILCKVETDKWLERIKKSSSKELNVFRFWLARTYFTNLNKNTIKKELKTIKEIRDKIDVNWSDDLIKRLNLEYFIANLDEIIETWDK